MDRQILNRYSRIPVDTSPAPSSTLMLNKTTNTSTETIEPTYIIRPIQYVFSPVTYLLGWGVTGMGVGAYVLLYSSIRHPYFFGMWAFTFLSQWALHGLVVWFKKQSLIRPRMFSNASVTSQFIFIGLIDFGITSVIFGILYMAWHM